MLNFSEAQLTTSFFHGHIFIFTMRLVLPDLHILKFVCGMKVWGFFFSPLRQVMVMRVCVLPDSSMLTCLILVMELRCVVFWM